MEVHSRSNPSHALRHDDSSTTSRWRRPRSSANLLQQHTQPATPLAVPAMAKPAPKPAPNPALKPAPKVERAPSKMSLFNLFSRPKVEKARGHTEVGLAVPMQPPTPKSAPVSTPKSALRLNTAPPIQQVHRSRSSQMMRPMQIKTTSIKRQPSNWDPPPLFQAYPQSIKYATLQACVFSSVALLRTQSQRRQNDILRERTDSHRDLATTLEANAETKKLDKSHKRLISNTVMSQSVPQLTNKVYVLVTSGYVLQYAGDGPFDRLPEKVLKLGKDSAAFACDLIPGKHWVLQISQNANQDGTVISGPKSSILSRLRLHNPSIKQATMSFLLVLESAQEMDSWMTTVRKEIEVLGGMKTKEESIRESSSLEESPVKTEETSSHRSLVQRDPNRMTMTKLPPVDSPHQSQPSEFPKIVASDWEGDRSEKTVSVADSSSLHSSQHSSKRKSVEAPSVTTTATANDQFSLDQLQERLRYSYISTGTSLSGTGTRDTSPNSSPASTSPLKEGFSPVDSEPIRGSTYLRSFHMTASTRRRSMQPLPVTNEDDYESAGSTRWAPQRHSIYGPASPTVKSPKQLDLDVTVSMGIRSTPNARFCASTQGPVRYSQRSSSAPPERNTIITPSPPPRDPAPVPPGRPRSTIGSLPSAAALNSVGMNTTRSERRISQSPRPFIRPFPIRPQNTDGSIIVPRRYSSMAPPPIPLGIVVNRSVTTPARPPSAAPSYSSVANGQTSPSSKPLRRPNSVQIRSDPAPFLSSSRPVIAPTRAIATTPSFVPRNRASISPALSRSPSFPSLSHQTQQDQRSVTPRRSMPALHLPPPAPPPNMPLPPPPTMPLPDLPALFIPQVVAM